MGEPRQHFRVCNLCEAMCGIVVEHDGERVLSIRGDGDDPFSQGHLCPKAVGLKDIHEDPDRLRRPQKRVGDRWIEVGWDEAFDEIGERLRAIRGAHGPDAVGFYQGNPTLHNYGSMLYGLAFGIGLGTRNRYSATSVDQLPHMLASLLMFGHQALLPVPDVDRTELMLMLGANPLASNGSLMTAGGIERRLRAMQARGGRLVVVDPRRTETAELADEHLFIQPGTDALFLLAIVRTLFDEGLVRTGRLAPLLDGEESLRAALQPFSAEAVAPTTGIDAETTRRLARALAATPRAVCYVRVGVCLSEFGGVAAWAANLVNVLTGHLDREGGAMFPTPAVDVVGLAARVGQTGSYDKFRSRAPRSGVPGAASASTSTTADPRSPDGLPEFGGELPVAALADEIEMPGPGQVRALIVSAGNPVLSTPNGPRLARALDTLELLVAIDIYRNETARHAHFILPPTFALEHEHYDVGLHLVAVRNTAKFSPPLFAPAEGALHDWQIFVGLWSRMLADGATGRAAGALMRAALGAATPERLLDLLLRTGPNGSVLPFKKGLTVRALRKAPHGIDLGPLVPRFPEALYTETGRIRLDPPAFLADLPRLRATMAPAAATDGELRLIGRRDLRSNNSWMHNSLRLVKGPPRCTLLMHPEDAATRGLREGDRARIRSRVGEVEAAVALTDALLRGVVSLPHGWGHDLEGVELRVARATPGVSANALTDEARVDVLSGTAALNGVPVTVVRADAKAATAAE